MPTTATATAATRAARVRPLAAADLEAVVGIDASIVGRSRRAYFERRLRAAIADPAMHVQFGVEDEGRLIGYALARRLAGEFGRTVPALRLEIIGVRPDDQGRSVGDWLMAAFSKWGREHGVTEMRTQVDWRNSRMLRFLAHSGFRLGRNQVIEAAVRPDDGDDAELSIAPSFEQPSAEMDYSADRANDFEVLARDRFDLRSMATDDAEAVARIDRRIMARERSGYVKQLLGEALADSGVRVSLVAYVEGVLAGYVMAKTDFGDFGRTEPVAVIDTLGIDPDFAGRGIGKALLSQLFVNLHALGVERVETVVARENFALLGFFYRAGFGASERLAFVKDFATA